MTETASRDKTQAASRRAPTGLEIQFCGAARTVTGSCTRVTAAGRSFLVDCGLFQGTQTIRDLNRQPFPFKADMIDFVLLTHAHIDHSGLLPKLYKAGFDGPCYMTRGSRDLLSFMLVDSGHIQEQEVERLNRRFARRGRAPIEPIYTAADAEACQRNFVPVDYDTWIPLGDGLQVRYWNAGHILGSASVEIQIAARPPRHGPTRMLFSGDIGPDHKLFHPDPAAASGLDHVICEATYGDRGRRRASISERRDLLASEVNRALDNDGILLIPAFAVERTQELLTDLTVLQTNRAIPAAPIFLDSPMAIRATEVFEDHAGELEDFDPPRTMFTNRNLRFTETVSESKAINRFTAGAIILAASGMCEAGRILHHLKAHLWRPKATVLFVGYQAEGTLGRLLVDGIKAVRIHGAEIRVRARIRQIDSYSGHADQRELLAWIEARQPVAGGLFLTHGEQAACMALRAALIDRGWPADRVSVPSLDDVVDLDDLTPAAASKPGRRPAGQVIGGLDWNNDLAQFQIDLQEALDRRAGHRARAALLRRLRRALRDQA